MAVDEQSFTYATLLTNDNYLNAALALAQSLRNSGTEIPFSVLVTSQVTEKARSQLNQLHSSIVPVAAISGKSSANLQIIGRPDLHTTLTKLHLWTLTEYSRVVYLDADTLVLANLDHLFSLDESIHFAASPELGFPDCFNSGMMVLRPSQRTFAKLSALAHSEESFDGGDQGILNVFFGDGTFNHPSKMALEEAKPQDGEIRRSNSIDSGVDLSDGQGRQPNWYRLSFTYNMEMHRVYRMYIPAVLRYRREHKVLHFIGKDKPWHFEGGKVELEEDAPAYASFYAEMVGKWWDSWRQARETLGIDTDA